jgi:hypothetical protein
MKAIYAQACFSSSSLPVADMRILTIAAVFAALCPTASMACRQPMSPMARLTMLISDPHRPNMTPRPSVVAGDNCPDRDQAAIMPAMVTAIASAGPPPIRYEAAAFGGFRSSRSSDYRRPILRPDAKSLDRAIFCWMRSSDAAG